MIEFRCVSRAIAFPLKPDLSYMAYAYQLKLSAISNLSDARFAAAAGINYIGFCFDTGSSDLIPPLKAKEIIDWTSGSHVVGEFGNQDIEEIKTIAELLQVDIVELDNAMLPDELAAIEFPIIKVVDAAHFNAEQLQTELKAYQPHVQAFRLKNWEHLLIAEPTLLDAWKGQVFLELNENNSQTEQLLHQIKPFGISVHGGNEERVGLRDFDALNALLERLEVVE